MSDPHKSDSPLVQLMVSMSGASAGEHDSEPPGADINALKAGHEADRFGVKAIILVPVFVAIVLAATYVIVTVTFNAINHPPDADPSRSDLVKQNQAPINERFARTSSTDPKNLDGQPSTLVPQPRLEYLRQSDDGGKNDPPYYRSKLPSPTGNSPEISPEDLRPSRYIDPVTRQKQMEDTGWRDPDKKTVAYIPIDQAITAVLKQLPVRKDPIAVSGTGDGMARQSNAGRGGPSQTATPVAPAAKDHK